jgi:hypothetical protein
MTQTEPFSFQISMAKRDIIEAADAVTGWYDRWEAAKHNRRDFPATQELRELNITLQKAVRRWRAMTQGEEKKDDE